MFDISTLAVADTADLELNGPNGKPLFNDKGVRCTITMYGPASEQFAQMRAVQQERLVEHMSQGDDRKPYTAEETNKLTAEDLCLVTKSFNHFKLGDFATPAEMHEAAYARRDLGWLRDQANAFFGKWGNYPAASPAK